MTINQYANTLFDHFDKELDRKANEIRNRIFSLFREIQWTPEQYRSLQPLIREELDGLVYHLLNSLDNAGSVLPKGVLGFEIRAYNEDDGIISSAPIRESAFPDYGEMWEIYRRERSEKKILGKPSTNKPRINE